MSKDGENAKSITEGVGARWSPDGTKLAFLRTPKKPGGKGSLWVANADGTGERKVRDDDSPAWEVAWYPDGKSIVFASDQERKSVIFRVNLDGSSLAAIASDKRLALFFPVFSPDGLQLLADAFPVGDSRQIPTPALEAGAGNGTILLVDLTGHPTKVLAHGIHPTAVWAHE
jgi:Tol biopolymer transport system component